MTTCDGSFLMTTAEAEQRAADEPVCFRCGCWAFRCLCKTSPLVTCEGVSFEDGQAFHDAMKRDSWRWRKDTTHVGWHQDSVCCLELRNCKRCGSTLVVESPPPDVLAEEYAALLGNGCSILEHTDGPVIAGFRHKLPAALARRHMVLDQVPGGFVVRKVAA